MNHPGDVVDRASRTLGDAAAGAEHLPGHLEEPGRGRVQAGDQGLAAVGLPTIRQLEGAHLEHLVVWRGLEVAAQRGHQRRRGAGPE